YRAVLSPEADVGQLLIVGVEPGNQFAPIWRLNRLTKLSDVKSSRPSTSVHVLVPVGTALSGRARPHVMESPRNVTPTCWQNGSDSAALNAVIWPPNGMKHSALAGMGSATEARD